MQLQWQNGSADTAYMLDALNPDMAGQADAPHGVLVIWRRGLSTKTAVILYVGRGILRNELEDCRRDPLFREPGLRVAWACVDLVSVDRVAAYLYETLWPVWGDSVSAAEPLPVNLPMTA